MVSFSSHSLTISSHFFPPVIPVYLVYSIIIWGYLQFFNISYLRFSSFVCCVCVVVCWEGLLPHFTHQTNPIFSFKILLDTGHPPRPRPHPHHKMVSFQDGLLSMSTVISVFYICFINYRGCDSNGKRESKAKSGEPAKVVGRRKR